MMILRYILASLWHHRRGHLGVTLGAMIGAAVLIGALWVGDAVRNRLTQRERDRLGEARSVLVTGERFFAADLSQRLTELDGHRQAALLLLPGAAWQPDTGLRAAAAQVAGVDAAFWALAPREKSSAPEAGSPAPGEAFVNQDLARQLRVQAGDRLLLRVDDPGPMAREAPLATAGQTGRALTVTIRAVVDRRRFGHFALTIEPMSPLSVFVDRHWLADQLHRPGRANVLLSTAPGPLLRQSLANHWRLTDLELEWRALPEQGVFELRSHRVFLDPPVATAAAGVGTAPLGVLTYFVNQLRHGPRATPYSMVAAIGPLAPPPEISPEISLESPPLATVTPQRDPPDIAASRWLAEDLRVQVGDPLQLSFYVLQEGRRLREMTVETQVKTIVPMDDPRADPTLMPAFPGLAGQENCRDWDPGFPLDLSRIRPADEAYWNVYRGTPKAWVCLSAGQAWWANRFGSLTAIRWEMPGHDREDLQQQLRRRLDPMTLGWRVMDWRDPALAAARQTIDLGGLFLGCSMFLVLAAAILTALLFALGIQNRQSELGALLALGIGSRRVRRWLLLEGAVPALVGTALGALLALGYAQGVLWGLSGLWRGAVGMAQGLPSDEPLGSLSLSARSMGIGMAVNFAMALLAMGLAIWTHRRRSVRTLLSGLPEERPWPEKLLRHKWKVALVPGILCLGLALMAARRAGSLPTSSQVTAFFLAGVLGLAGLLLLVRAGLWWLAGWSGRRQASLTLAGLRALSRQPGRNLAAIAMLACGLFLVVAVQAQRPLPPEDPQYPASGTGGFSLWAQSSMPIAYHPDDLAARQSLGLDVPQMQGVALLPWRLRDGDETSCLNLQRPEHPRLLGLSAAALAQRGAFTFASYWRPAWEKDLQVPAPERARRINPDSPWWLLVPPSRPEESPGQIEFSRETEIPGVVDVGTLHWSLGKRVGDLVQVIDGRGQVLSIRIVAALQRSILQGGIVIDEEAFVRHFPLETGYRGMLAALPAPADQAQVWKVQETLSQAYEDLGLEVVTTSQRLARFNAVEEAYLAIFQMLGGLGLMLGCAGLGVVVLRQAGERRGELATLEALGFHRRQLGAMLLVEHGAVVILGSGCGFLAAMLSLLPMWKARSAAWSDWGPVSAGVMLGAFLAIVPAVWWALRGPMLRRMTQESTGM